MTANSVSQGMGLFHRKVYDNKAVRDAILWFMAKIGIELDAEELRMRPQGFSSMGDFLFRQGFSHATKELTISVNFNASCLGLMVKGGLSKGEFLCLRISELSDGFNIRITWANPVSDQDPYWITLDELRNISVPHTNTSFFWTADPREIACRLSQEN